MKRIKIGLFAVTTFFAMAVTAFSATPLVDSQWLANNLEKDNIVIIDLRNKIDGGSYQTYLEGHIPGALHSDYLKDGWRVGRDNVVGLLPSEEQFEALARKLGVSGNSHVILVPAGVNSTDFGSAARAYWTFKVFGHDNVSILDGGFADWKSQYPQQIQTGAVDAPALGDFDARFSSATYVDTPAIAKIVAGKQSSVLLDGRNEKQFYGEGKHPKSRTHGRLPGSVLISQANAYNTASNKLKSADELEKIYSDVSSGPVVSYCNTGHWAATNWFVLSEILNHKDVKLYDGSMVEWTANADNPLETGKSNLDSIKGFIKKITN